MTFSMTYSQYNYVIDDYLMKWEKAYSTMLNEKSKAIKQYVQEDLTFVKKNM